ncbi:MAG: hypothetical protein WD226_06485 [Planctomycetota bacterium]
MHEQGKIDVHGVSVRGTTSAKEHDQFAIADIAKSMRVHRSSLGMDDASEIHGETQGHVYLLVEAPGKSPVESASAVDALVHYILNELPWTQLTQGEPLEVAAALDDAVASCRRQVETELSLILAFAHWPELYVARTGHAACFLSRGDSHENVGAAHPTGDGEAEGAPRAVTQRRLVGGDILTIVNRELARDLDLSRIRRRLGVRVTAASMCEAIADGADARQRTQYDRTMYDRTVIVARFLPDEPKSAPDDAEPPDELGSHARPGQRPTSTHPGPAPRVPAP